MQEKLLQYIWRFQLFQSRHLHSVCGQCLNIFYPGLWNNNQGPDFLNADISIGKIRWVGHVEVHVLSSDWRKHQHDGDPHYNNIVLHVVWEHDIELNLPFSTLELRNVVPKILLEKYDSMMKAEYSIPCKPLLANVNNIIIEKCKENMVIERLHSKAKQQFGLKDFNEKNWEEQVWQSLAYSLGGKVNGIAFQMMAEKIPFQMLKQVSSNRENIEALLFGCCGLLNDDFLDQYPKTLKSTYISLLHELGLTPQSMRVGFLRMRPAGFPTIRLSQLAQLVFEKQFLLHSILNSENLEELYTYFDVKATNYWSNHYIFEVTSTFREKRLGESAIRNIIINVVVVLNYAYGYITHSEALKHKAIDWLLKLQPEKNNITEIFKDLPISLQSAYDTQAVAHLYNGYCLYKKCMQCSIGYALLRNAS
jgi:hypothetical protein